MRRKLGGLGAGVAVLLAACGGGGGGGASSPAPVVQGAVVKGPVLGATVCAFQVTGGAKGAPLALSSSSGATGTINAGCYVTPADGSYNVALPAGTSGDVLLEATGGQFCTNEAQVASGACAGGGTLVSLAGSTMRAVATVAAGGTTTVYTTPLTTAAVANAGGTLSAATFAAQFNTLAGQLGSPGITPSASPTTATQPYLAATGTYLAGGGTLSNAVGSLAQGTTTFSSTPSGGVTTTATISPTHVGTKALQFRVGSGAGCTGTGCTFTDNQSVSVTVHGDNRLELPGGKILTNPFHRSFNGTPNTHEIIWLDAAAHIEYALSDNQGTFNEINVGDAAAPGVGGIPRFLGQLRTPVNHTLALLTALAGTYDKAYQYNGNNVPWTSVTIGDDGGITFNGGAGPSVTAAQVVSVGDWRTCCGRIDARVDRDLNGNGVDAEDKISIYLSETGAVRSISYDPGTQNMADDVGVRVDTVTPLQHDGTTMTTGTGIHGTLNGTAMDFALSAPVSVNTMGISIAAGADVGPDWNIQIATGTLQVGTYQCMNTPGGSVLIQARLTAGAFPYTTRNGGRCTINITTRETSGSTVTLLEGTFTAELFDTSKQNVTPRVVTNGRFRYAPP